ncbi:MAG: hypothetical protein WC516_07650 [Patescibacteria group bacterium]
MTAIDRDTVLAAICEAIRKTVEGIFAETLLTAETRFTGLTSADWQDQANILAILDEQWPGIDLPNFDCDDKTIGDLADFICAGLECTEIGVAIAPVDPPQPTPVVTSASAWPTGLDGKPLRVHST